MVTLNPADVPDSDFAFVTVPGDVSIAGDCYSLDLDSAPRIKEVVTLLGQQAVMFITLQEDDLTQGVRAE